MSVRDVRMYFNSYLVLKKTFDAELKFLDKMGAYVVSDANRSMRSAPILKKTGKRKATGSTFNKKTGVNRPPYARKGYLKKFNYWFVDPVKEQVRCGPALLQGARNPIPGVHELGMTITQKRTDRKGGTKSVRARYPKRPYMFPALKKNEPKVRELRNSIKR